MPPALYNTLSITIPLRGEDIFMKTGLERIGGIMLIVVIATVAYATHMFIRAKVSPNGKDKPAIEHGTTGDVPVSVLHYPECTEQDKAEGNCALRETVPCYAGEKIKKFFNEKNAETPYSLLLTGTSDNGSHMELYETDEPGGKFFILSVGMDRAGTDEVCVIASGTTLKWGPPLPDETGKPAADMASEPDAEE